VDEEDYSYDDSGSYDASYGASGSGGFSGGGGATGDFSVGAPTAVLTAPNIKGVVDEFHHIVDLVGGNPLSHGAADGSSSSGSLFSSPWVLGAGALIVVLVGLLLLV